MLPKCTVLLLVIVAVKSATLQGRNIPVEVRYERLDHDINSNLEEKIQLSSGEIKENNLRLEKLNVAEEDLSPKEEHYNFVKNFNEKIQLSPEELLQSSKRNSSDYNKQENDEILELRGAPLVSSKSDATSKAFLLQQAQDIIKRDLNSLRKNFKPRENDISPSKELWEKLEGDIRDYFVKEKNNLGLRQAPPSNQQNFIQNLMNGVQQVTGNFIQQFQSLGQNPNGTIGDEGQVQGPIQGFVGYFTGGVQSIVNNIQNIGQSVLPGGNSTILGDTGTDGSGGTGSQQPGNIFGNIFNNLFQGTAENGTQAGNGGAGVQQGFFAGAISQINQAVGSIIPSSSQAPPAAQGDEGTNNSATSQPAGPIQQVVQSIGTAVNQFLQGGQQQNKPQGSEDENNGSQPPNQNFIQSIGQNLGNAFQSIQNQFIPPGGFTQRPAVESSDGGNSNPIVGQVSNIGNQLQQLVGQGLIPGNSSSAKQPEVEKL